MAQDPSSVAQRGDRICTARVSPFDARDSTDILHRDIEKGNRTPCEEIILPEISRLKTRGSSFGDAKSILKMLVECVEETIGEAPKEEEDGDEANRVERFFERELGGSRALLV